MARDLDALLAVADDEIVLRSLLTEAERPLYHGHEGVRDWFDDGVRRVSRLERRSRGPRATTRTGPS